MSIAIHGDESIDEHSDNPTDRALHILDRLINLMYQDEGIRAGKVSKKSEHLTLLNHLKQHREKVLPFFDKEMKYLWEQINLRPELSDLRRYILDAKRNIEKQTAESKSEPEEPTED